MIGDIERYKQIDKGGAIYEFDSALFETDPAKNMHKTEWVSKVPVVPKDKECSASGLQAMKDNGVQVIVMSSEEFQVLKSLKAEKRYDEAQVYVQNFLE